MTGCPPGLGKLNLGAVEEQTVLLTAELPRKQTDRYSYLFTSCSGQGACSSQHGGQWAAVMISCLHPCGSWDGTRSNKTH